jgi:hypothetical protein
MDMKKLIAQMDAIENKKILKEDTNQINFDSQVDEFVKGNAAAKIAAWIKQIRELRAKGFHQAAADAEKSLAQVHPDYRTVMNQQTTPVPEFRGSIAKALMQDMGVDDQDVEEAGNQPPPGWNSEVNGPWMGDNPTMVPAVDSSGQPVQADSGGNVMSLGGGKQGEFVPPTTIGADDADAGGGEDPENYGYSGSDDPELYGYSGSDDPELYGYSGSDAPAGGDEQADTLDPNDVKRFGELLDKLEKGSGSGANPPTPTPPAPTPAAQGYKGSSGAQAIHKLNPQIKDINKIYPGQQLKMPDGSTYVVKPGDTMDKIARGMRSGSGANPASGMTTSPHIMQGTMPQNDPRAGRSFNTVREDDMILNSIRAIKV